jgi:hypothetical protein
MDSLEEGSEPSGSLQGKEIDAELLELHSAVLSVVSCRVQRLGFSLTPVQW